MPTPDTCPPCNEGARALLNRICWLDPPAWWQDFSYHQDESCGSPLSPQLVIVQDLAASPALAPFLAPTPSPALSFPVLAFLVFPFLFSPALPFLVDVAFLFPFLFPSLAVLFLVPVPFLAVVLVLVPFLPPPFPSLTPPLSLACRCWVTCDQEVCCPVRRAAGVDLITREDTLLQAEGEGACLEGQASLDGRKG